MTLLIQGLETKEEMTYGIASAFSLFQTHKNTHTHTNIHKPRKFFKFKGKKNGHFSKGKRNCLENLNNVKFV